MTVKLCLVFLLVFVGLARSNADPVKSYRLPNSTIPILYTVELATKIDQDGFKFYGNTTIVLRAEDDTSSIVLHSALAKIAKVEVKSADSFQALEVDKFSEDNETEFLTISLKKSLRQGKSYILEISYSSELRKDNLGFYRSSYVDNNGDEIWLAATQFAPTHARHAFPCYDEPKYKTSFSLQITHSNHLHAISNMRVEKKIPNSDNTTLTIFETSPELPTYLIGFVISDFRKQILQKKGFVQETYARPNGLSLTRFSADFGANAFEEFMSYFQSVDMRRYLRVLKQVALPTFHFSGMENFGMVTYKEGKIFFDPAEYEAIHKIKIMYLVGHEMAHHWFGDLVTMKWWTHVWMKEGFSTLYAYYVQDMLYPTWNMMEAYQANVLHLALSVDGEKSSRPMTKYVETQNDIRNNYDKIAYEKSSAVLRMFDHAMGRDTFKRVIDLYLQKFKLSTVDEQSLFDVIDEVTAGSNRNFSKSLKSWTSQGGYPVVEVTTDPQQGTLIFRQKKFLLNGDKTKNSILWEIPINYITTKNSQKNPTTSPDFWLETRNKTISVPKERWNPLDWVLVNVQQTGYYRVNYDTKNWELLRTALLKSHGSVDTQNRAQLIDDAFSLAEAGLLHDYAFPIDLARYLVQERDYSPWAAFATQIRRIAIRLEGHAIFNKLGTAMANLLKAPAEAFKASPTDESPLRAETRRLVAHIANHFELNIPLPQSKEDEYCEALKNNKTSTYNRFKESLQTSADMVLRETILSALGCTADGRILQLLLLQTLQDKSDFNFVDKERVQLLNSVFKKSQKGRTMAMQFMLTHWRTIETVYPADSLKSIITDWSLYINNDILADSFNEILDKVNIPKTTANTARQNIISTLDWIVRAEPDIEKYLSKL